MKSSCEIILGSSSPRRTDLLSRLDLPFRVVHPEVEEIAEDGESPKAYVLRNSRAKGEWVLHAVAGKCKSTDRVLVIAADTIVVLDGMILEKPRHPADARRMLGLLSGRTHQVWSGIAVVLGCGGTGSKGKPAVLKRRVKAVKTDVTMKSFSKREIAWYVASGEPLDKAGSYGAQGIGHYLIHAIHGSYTNVVGLPMAELVEMLEHEFGVPMWKPGGKK